MDERRRAQKLIHKHLDQVASPEELAELARLLSASPEAADEFAAAARIDAFLAEHFAEQQRTLEVTALLREAGAPAEPSARRRRRRLPARWLAAAAVLLLAIGSAAVYHLGSLRGWWQPGAAGPYRVVFGQVLVGGEESRAVAAGSRVVVPRGLPALVRLPDGSGAELAPLSEVVFRGGAEGVRERVELVEGRGRFEVAEGEGQFRVETALGTVTVLGTEFTVELWSVAATSGGATAGETAIRALAVAVARGQVQVEREGETHVLSAGESRVFSVGVRHQTACAPPAPQPGPRPGGEAMPALPLPATPQRRVETKKHPAPPAIVVKLTSGDPADWATDPHDIHNLLAWMGHKLDIPFSYEEKALAEVKLDAARLPMLYRTGHHAFRFSEAERQRLRDYVLGGGFVFFDACCGRREFAESVRRELAAIFPERPLRPLPADHPLYWCFYDVPEVRYTPAAGIEGLAAPPLEGLEVGCRTAVVFSPLDLSCGWDLHTHETCAGVQAEYALKLGANLVAYATATKTMSTSLAEARVYADEERVKADKFRIGHVVHSGQWNPDPAGLATLLDMVGANTSLKVSFDTQPLHLDSEALASFPFIYLTGHDDFTLSDAEVAALRGYLEAGGFLLADACCGRRAFDAAFRREMARVLPGAELRGLSPRHRIYSIHHRIRTVEFTQAAVAQQRLASPGAPRLEGMTLNGQLAVVYSPLDLGCGWELKPHPFGVGYQWRDAIRLGVNVVMYAVSH